ncbi:MAG: TetR/AcrR family transcriptional regulator [Gordonia sp. (in: high G+C Gram-positive bacteria)]
MSDDGPIGGGAAGKGPRERMIVHAADLIGRDGVAATSIGDVITASGAPRGSIYHHFPGGRTQLMTEAIRYAGDRISTRIAQGRPGSAGEVAVAVGEQWRRMLVATDYEFGCPVLAAGLARRTEPAVADEAEQIFADWVSLISSRLVMEGIDVDRATSLAELVITAIEGAVGLCQTRRSVAPLDRVIDELARSCEAARRDGYHEKTTA